MTSLTRGTRAVAALAFLLLSFVWIGLRWGPGQPDETTTQLALESVRVVEVSGRVAARGVPSSEDYGGLFRGDASRAAVDAFTARLDAINGDLQRRATDAARTIARDEPNGVLLTTGGVTARFTGADAARLRDAHQHASLRPLDALVAIESVVRARLESAPLGIEIDETTERRELTRFVRNLEDEIAAARDQSGAAVLRFQRQAVPTATGPDEMFFRRGPARLLEALLAGLLGVTLAVARRGGSVVGSLVATAAGALGGVGSLLALEGGPLLPTGPDGTAPVFVLIAFAVGALASGLARSIGERRSPTSASPISPVTPTTRRPTPAPLTIPRQSPPAVVAAAAKADTVREEDDDLEDVPTGPPPGPFPYEDIREIAREVLRNGRRRRPSTPAAEDAGASGEAAPGSDETPRPTVPDLEAALAAAANAVARVEATRREEAADVTPDALRSETEVEEDEGILPRGPGRRSFGDPLEEEPAATNGREPEPGHDHSPYAPRAADELPAAKPVERVAPVESVESVEPPAPDAPPPEEALRERPLRATRPRPLPPAPETLPFFRKRRR